MVQHQFYLDRCIELARLGAGSVSPNPMVGAVIVCDDQIIGEGYHMAYGHAHAEVNAINNVFEKNANAKQLLKRSTIYVNLEPCSHYGKTPPCADLIISN
ncbi:MAG: riboflavin biosynthesis protein RibD, partial [Bacteroidetes bacterium]|nr:riboflavin biosynthesis protein RibD [Bacteroidota bacterium]